MYARCLAVLVRLISYMFIKIYASTYLHVSASQNWHLTSKVATTLVVMVKIGDSNVAGGKFGPHL